MPNCQVILEGTLSQLNERLSHAQPIIKVIEKTVSAGDETPRQTSYRGKPTNREKVEALLTAGSKTIQEVREHLDIGASYMKTLVSDLKMKGVIEVDDSNGESGDLRLLKLVSGS